MEKLRKFGSIYNFLINHKFDNQYTYQDIVGTQITLLEIKILFDRHYCIRVKINSKFKTKKIKI